jgi:dGTPase
VTLEQLSTLPFFAAHLRRIEREHPGVTPQRLRSEAVREMIGELVSDLVRTSAAAIAAAAPRRIDEVRALPHGLIELSAPLKEAQLALKDFLRESLYTHPHIRRMTQQAHETVRFLFAALTADYGRMPDDHAARAKAAAAAGDAAGAARVVADYIAGMTDRFALETRDALRGKV